MFTHIFRALAALTLLATAHAQQRNVLLIIADDYGVDSNSLYNTSASASLPPTPNINALKQSGVLFRNAYASPECSPSRACLLTGRHAFRHGIGSAITGSGDPQLPASEFTLPDAFAANSALGYQLALFGKYHLNLGPNSPGTMAGWPHFSGAIPGALASYTSWTKTVNGVQTPGYTVYATSENVTDATTWIAARGAQPWFAAVAFNAGHTPLHKPPNNLHSSDALVDTPAAITANPRAYYNAMIEAMDTEIGRLLAAVDPANTNIIFLGDNGTTNLLIQPPFPNTRGKSTLNEGGIHVPLIIAGPDVAAPNRESTAPVHCVDLFATILELAGINVATTVSGSVALDSRSLLPILKNTTDSERHAYSEFFGANVNANAAGRAVRGAQFKLIHFTSGARELYDLAADPYESANLLAGTLTAPQQSNLDRLTLKLAQYQSAVPVPVVTTAERVSGQFNITVQRVASTAYTLWRAPDLNCASWSQLTGAVITTGATTVQLTDPNAAGEAAYYRVMATPQ